MAGYEVRAPYLAIEQPLQAEHLVWHGTVFVAKSRLISIARLFFRANNRQTFTESSGRKCLIANKTAAKNIKPITDVSTQA